MAFRRLPRICSASSAKAMHLSAEASLQAHPRLDQAGIFRNSGVSPDHGNKATGRRRAPSVLNASLWLEYCDLFPEAGEAIDRASVASAVLGCHPAIGTLGRRTRQSFVGNNAAIVDFGLHVATLCGSLAQTRLILIAWQISR